MYKAPQTLQRSAMFSDHHWGAKGNSEQHNQDCLQYIEWFCLEARKNNVDHVVFLGDWFENRSALNVSTLHYSYLGAKKLNDLGIPIYFIIGNHDLYHKHTREIYSTIFFNEFDNFIIITEPTIIKEIESEPLMCPYLFHNEYTTLVEYKNTTVWMGHFEFQGFIVTGNTIRLLTGPNPDDFEGPKYIFSGHFHKRQISKNIIYIGNTFPTTFSDANDSERGMMIYDYITHTPSFINWGDCPQYIKTSLSEILDGDISLPIKSRVKCLIDIPLNYEEYAELKQSFVANYSLREFAFEEEAITNLTEFDENDQQSNPLETTDELIVRMLSDVNAPKIDNTKLIQTYQIL